MMKMADCSMIAVPWPSTLNNPAYRYKWLLPLLAKILLTIS